METKNKNIKNDENQSSKNNNPISQEDLDKAALNNPINRENIGGTVSERFTGTSPSDTAGVSDIDGALSRGSRRSR